MQRAPSVVPKEAGSIPGELDDYYCPVCGVELPRSDFLTPERDYYCPFCGTRQTPSVV